MGGLTPPTATQCRGGGTVRGVGVAAKTCHLIFYFTTITTKLTSSGGTIHFTLTTMKLTSSNGVTPTPFTTTNNTHPTSCCCRCCCAL